MRGRFPLHRTGFMKCHFKRFLWVCGLALVFFSAGCFLFPPPHSDYRPVHQYSLACDSASVQAILNTNDAAANARDDSKRTPLHDAASRNCTNVISLLLARGAKLEARDQAGETPLHVAAQEGSVEAAEMLIEAGAKLNPRDKKGFTPLKRAVLYEQNPVIRLLRSKGAKE